MSSNMLTKYKSLKIIKRIGLFINSGMGLHFPRFEKGVTPPEYSEQHSRSIWLYTNPSNFTKHSEISIQGSEPRMRNNIFPIVQVCGRMFDLVENWKLAHVPSRNRDRPSNN